MKLINDWWAAISSRPEYRREKSGKHNQKIAVADKAGVHLNTLRRVLNTGDCRVDTLQALLKATGFELQIVETATGCPVELAALEKEYGLRRPSSL